jgi:hypothetical protein
MGVTQDGQTGMDEQVIEDAEILEALQARQAAREIAAGARKVAKAAHDRAMVQIEKLELPLGATARVGLYRVTRTVTAAKHVNFDTAPGERIKISLAPDGD